MTTRRGASHVRPRPPSSGRPRRDIRPPAPATQRVRRNKGIDARRRKLPLAARLVLVAAVASLAGVVFLTANGALGPLVAALGSGVDQALGKLTATPEPTASEAIIATDSPIIVTPASVYTNEPTAELRIVVPAEVVGSATAKLRLYLALEGLQPAPIADVAIGDTTRLSVPVELTKGRNDFTATIIRDGVESDPSLVVTLFLDQDPPKITVTSPKNGAEVNEADVTIKGASQAGTDLIARNATNGTSVGGEAGTDGTFTLILPLEPGTNQITIDATDPAGNTASLALTYVQGTGEMGASLSASQYLISVSHPPGSLQLRVFVSDPTGAPLAGATATFTLQIPGLGPISNSVVTGADGRASFTTSLVGPMTTGNGLATVLVTHPLFGQTTDRVALTFVK